MNYPATTAAVLAVFLGACSGNPNNPNTGGGGTGGTGGTGGGTGSGTTATPLASKGAASVLLDGSNATAIVYNDTNDSVTVTAIPFDGDVVPSAYDRDPANDVRTFKAYADRDGFDTYRMYRGETDSGQGTATVVGTGDYADHGYYGAQYTRSGSTTLPTTTQRGYYTGNYVAVRTIDDGNAGMDRIQGDAELEVDFSDTTVRGAIRNRIFIEDQTGVALDGTLVMKNTELRTTGADFSGAVVPANTASTGDGGTYNGALVGTDAPEAVGVIQYESNDTRETGIFTVKR